MHGTMCMPDTHGGRKMVLDSLETELLMVLSHSQRQGHVSAGNGTHILWKSNMRSNPMCHLPSPQAFHSHYEIPSLLCGLLSTSENSHLFLHLSWWPCFYY